MTLNYILDEVAFIPQKKNDSKSINKIQIDSTRQLESPVITMIYSVVCKVGSSTQTRETVKIQIGSRSLNIILLFFGLPLREVWVEHPYIPMPYGIIY